MNAIVDSQVKIKGLFALRMLELVPVTVTILSGQAPSVMLILAPL